MANYRASPSRPDRAKAIAAVVAVHAAIAALILTSPATVSMIGESDPTVLIDIKPPPPPPPPEPQPQAERAKDEEGAAGKKAEPTPIVAPKPRIVVPAKPPVVAAPIAGTGSSASAGAATAGSGPGAGGSGSGRGGGGSGGGGGGIGTEARLLGGNSSRLPSSLLRQFAADRGYGHLWLTISESGRVTDCNVLQTTGDARVDQALCSLMIRQSRWAAARDRQGNPITVKVRYTATWSKD
jgi:protein TonB